MKTAYTGETITIDISLSSTDEGPLAAPARVDAYVSLLGKDTGAEYKDVQGPPYSVDHTASVPGDHIIVVEIEDTIGRVSVGVEKLRVLPIQKPITV